MLPGRGELCNFGVDFPLFLYVTLWLILSVKLLYIWELGVLLQLICFISELHAGLLWLLEALATKATLLYWFILFLHKGIKVKRALKAYWAVARILIFDRGTLGNQDITWESLTDQALVWHILEQVSTFLACNLLAVANVFWVLKEIWD